MIDGIPEVPSLQVLVNTNKSSLILVNKKMEKQFLFSQIACNVEKCFALTRCLMYRYWLLVQIFVGSSLYHLYFYHSEDDWNYFHFNESVRNIYDVFPSRLLE